MEFHIFLQFPDDYSDWAAIPLLIISSMATALWSFQDVLIVLLSMGLTSRYHRLNKFVAKISAFEKKQIKWDNKTEALKVYTWRKIREAYVKQAALVRKVDGSIGGMIVLSCSCNFYFICLQLFLGITTGKSISNIRRVYFVVSLVWLCIRIGSVVLAAADINVYSRGALNYIYECEPHCYNVEVVQVSNLVAKKPAKFDE
ncbi:Gustatory receptor [Operophtera brumata]|uniref:Gustatory receptor n=1 Tax=Operophtera brumata TaxID=104452 RepID=A0A0L7KZH7_OPEBR|nr:Gustatory receptor [Operophtera brumata]